MDPDDNDDDNDVWYENTRIMRLVDYQCWNKFENIFIQSCWYNHWCDKQTEKQTDRMADYTVYLHPFCSSWICVFNKRDTGQYCCI